MESTEKEPVVEEVTTTEGIGARITPAGIFTTASGQGSPAKSAPKAPVVVNAPKTAPPTPPKKRSKK